MRNSLSNWLPPRGKIIGNKVPVLMHDNREICQYFLEESALLKCLGKETE